MSPPLPPLKNWKKMWKNKISQEGGSKTSPIDHFFSYLPPKYPPPQKKSEKIAFFSAFLDVREKKWSFWKNFVFPVIQDAKI